MKKPRPGLEQILAKDGPLEELTDADEPGPTAMLAAPEDYRATLRYAWGVPGVAVANLGLRTLEELRQALAAARSFQPLSAAEMAALTERGKQMAAKWGLIRGPVA